MQTKYNSRYWNSEITRAKDAHKDFQEEARQSVRLYKSKHQFDDVARKLSVWWYLVETLLPAYFSRLPKVETSLRSKSGSTLHQIAALAAQRAAQYELDDRLRFDVFAQAAAKSLLLSGRSVAWLRYEAEIEDREAEIGLVRGADGLIYDGEGKRYSGEESEIYSTESGLAYKRQYSEKLEEKTVLECVNYLDYLSCPARTPDEEEWRARRAYMSQEAVTQKFGKDVADSMKFDSFPEELERGRSKDLSLYEGKAELWEIYCRETEKVYWCQQAGEKSVLESGEPPIEFDDFWPCEVLTVNTDPDSTIPTSDYTQLKDQILEVERLTTRIMAMVQAVRANGVYDATLGPVVEGLLKGDLKMDPLKNWPSSKAKGGLTSGIEMLDISPYTAALTALTKAREVALERLYESVKASDLIRGVTDPRETATAQEYKQKWSSLGLSVRQDQFARFISRCVGKVGEVILTRYSDERIAEAANLEELVMQAQSSGMQVMPEQVIQVLRDDRRRFRIEIATDSLVALDERADRQERVDLVASFGSFFGQMDPILDKYPVLATFAMEMARFVTRTYRAGKELEPIFLGAMQQVAMMAQQKAQAAAQQPPDPTMIAAQAQVQVAQIEAQTKQAGLQVTLQEAGTKAQLEQTRLGVEVQLKQSELQVALEKLKLEQMRLEAEMMAKGQELAIRERESARDTALETVRVDIDRRMGEVQQALDAAKVENERQKTYLDGYEKLLEERRLALEHSVATRGELPPINIQVDAKQPARKVGRVVRDAEGRVSGIETEDA